MLRNTSMISSHALKKPVGIVWGIIWRVCLSSDLDARSTSCDDIRNIIESFSGNNTEPVFHAVNGRSVIDVIIITNKLRERKFVQDVDTRMNYWLATPTEGMFRCSAFSESSSHHAAWCASIMMDLSHDSRNLKKFKSNPQSLEDLSEARTSVMSELLIASCDWSRSKLEEQNKENHVTIFWRNIAEVHARQQEMGILVPSTIPTGLRFSEHDTSNVLVDTFFSLKHLKQHSFGNHFGKFVNMVLLNIKILEQKQN